MDRTLTLSEVAGIENTLQGVRLTDRIRHDARMLVIKFQGGVKTIAGLGIMGVLGWQLFEEERIPIAAMAVGLLLTLAIWKKQG